MGRARAAVHAAGNVDGRRLDAVAIEAAEHFLLRNVLVDNHGVVDEDFGDARILRHVADELELVVERLLLVRHRLPLRPFLDFLHLVGRSRAAKDFAAERRLLEQGIDGVAAPCGVRRILVVRAEEAPFGGIVERVLVDDAAAGGATCRKTVLHRHEGRAACVAEVSILAIVDKDCAGLSLAIIDDIKTGIEAFCIFLLRSKLLPYFALFSISKNPFRFLCGTT